MPPYQTVVPMDGNTAATTSLQVSFVIPLH
jgi:hypothetical protein